MEVPMITTQPLFADGEPTGRGIIAFGMDGYIIPMGPASIMKIPKLDATILPDGSIEPDKDNVWKVDGLEIEKEVYRRLLGVTGLANFLNISTNGLELEYYRNGDLEDYVKNNPAPS